MGAYNDVLHGYRVKLPNVKKRLGKAHIENLGGVQDENIPICS